MPGDPWSARPEALQQLERLLAASEWDAFVRLGSVLTERPDYADDAAWWVAAADAFGRAVATIAQSNGDKSQTLVLAVMHLDALISAVMLLSNNPETQAKVDIRVFACANSEC